MITGETCIRVRYAETDQMGVVYHSNYLVWMECGRVELCRARGVAYREMEQDGVVLAVVEVRCRYRRPARYDEEILVRTSIRRATRRIVEFAYTIESKEDGRLLAEGETVHVFVDRNMKVASLPEKYYDLFGISEKAGETPQRQ